MHIHKYIIFIYIYITLNASALQLTQKHTEELAEQTGSGASGGVGQMPPQFPNVSAQHQPDFEPEEEAGLELPPPMKPIQEPHLMANGPPAFPKDLKENSANLVSVQKTNYLPIAAAMLYADLYLSIYICIHINLYIYIYIEPIRPISYLFTFNLIAIACILLM